MFKEFLADEPGESLTTRRKERWFANVVLILAILASAMIFFVFPAIS